MTASTARSRHIREKRHERFPEPSRLPRPNGFDSTAALEDLILRLKEAVRADPTDANAYCVLGVILGRLGREQASIRAWTTATRLSPDDVQIATGLAMVLGRAGRTAEAHGVFAEIVEANPSLVAGLRLAEVRAGGGATRSFGSQPWSEHALSGDLAHFALPDLIDFLVTQRASGVLRLESISGQEGGEIVLFQGGLIGCMSPASRALDEILIESGAMNSDQPRSIELGQSAEAPYFLSCVLVDHGLLDGDALMDALREQVESGLRSLLRWKEGRFRFSDLDWIHGFPACAVALSTDARAVLLDLIRVIDEEKSLPKRPASPRPRGSSAELLSLEATRSRSRRSPRAGGH